MTQSIWGTKHRVGHCYKLIWIQRNYLLVSKFVDWCEEIVFGTWFHNRLDVDDILLVADLLQKRSAIYTVGLSPFHLRNIITVKNSLRYCLYISNPADPCETLQKGCFFPQKRWTFPTEFSNKFQGAIRQNCLSVDMCWWLCLVPFLVFTR